MRRVLKWVGIGLGSVFALLYVVSFIFYFVGRSRINDSYDVQAEVVEIPESAEAIERGRQLVTAPTACLECHGADLGGDVVFDQAGLVTIYGPNITSGRGSVVTGYTDADWVRAIRHGVNRDGKGLIIMPSEAYQHLSREDLGAIIAYAKSVPPVDRESKKSSFGFGGKILTGLGLFGDPIAAEVIDHDDLPFQDMPEIGVTSEYGGYLVSIGLCESCHGDDLSGGSIDPLSSNAPDLTRQGMAGRWTQDQFANVLRIGITPEGKQLDTDIMPWNLFTSLSDEDIEAIWLYLRSLPAED